MHNAWYLNWYLMFAYKMARKGKTFCRSQMTVVLSPAKNCSYVGVVLNTISLGVTYSLAISYPTGGRRCGIRNVSPERLNDSVLTFGSYTQMSTAFCTQQAIPKDLHWRHDYNGNNGDSERFIQLHAKSSTTIAGHRRYITSVTWDFNDLAMRIIIMLGELCQ
jgi:hypothetical protein